MQPNPTSIRTLSADQVNYTDEARSIQRAAVAGKCRVVKLGQIVFFSTATGDAWMLDPAERAAVCLARDFQAQPIPIQETPTRLAIEWDSAYKIDGPAFTVVQRGGSARTITGYPTAEIERLGREAPDVVALPADAATAVARFNSVGRNDACPCGNGKKYKKCCRSHDETVARQVADRQTQPVERTEFILTPTDLDESVFDEDDDDEPDENDKADPEPKLPAEVLDKVDRIWNEFEALIQPTTPQLDQFLDNLLALPSEATEWADLLHALAGKNHPDLLGVVRRIAATVPHTKVNGMSFFYWAAAECFSRHGLTNCLPEIATGFCRLDLESYDADGLDHLEDYLLANHFARETLDLAERFLPILRKDDGLMGYVVPGECDLIFDLRVGHFLQAGAGSLVSVDQLAVKLHRGLEEEIDADLVRLVAEIIAEPPPAPQWTRAAFELIRDTNYTDDRVWQKVLRLRGLLIHVARDAWQDSHYPPGCALRGLDLVLRAANENQSRRRKQKQVPANLLDVLRPAGLEARVAQACRDLMGVNAPRAQLMLDGHGLLLRFARRHQLISEADAAPTEEELERLQKKLLGRDGPAVQ